MCMTNEKKSSENRHCGLCSTKLSAEFKEVPQTSAASSVSTPTIGFASVLFLWMDETNTFKTEKLEEGLDLPHFQRYFLADRLQYI